MGTQRFQIAIELGARILVGLGVPAQPTTRVLIEQREQCVVRKGLIANNIDGADAGLRSFNHTEVQVHPVTLARRWRGHHLGGIQTAVKVLPLELLLRSVGQGFVKRTPLSQADVAQGFAKHICVKFFDAGEGDVRHDWALGHHHHDQPISHLNAHVREQAQTEQRANRLGALVFAVCISDTKRQ